MKRKAAPPFCFNTSRDMYYDFFTKNLRQHGNGLPVFAGARHQRGHGLGNTLGKLFPQNRDTAVSSLIKTGLNVASDISRGKKSKNR